MLKHGMKTRESNESREAKPRELLKQLLKKMQ